MELNDYPTTHGNLLIYRRDHRKVEEYIHHCDAKILKDTLNESEILCAAACIESFDQSFWLRLEDRKVYQKIKLAGTNQDILVKGKSIGIHYVLTLEADTVPFDI